MELNALTRWNSIGRDLYNFSELGTSCAPIMHTFATQLMLPFSSSTTGSKLKNRFLKKYQSTHTADPFDNEERIEVTDADARPPSWYVCLNTRLL